MGPPCTPGGVTAPHEWGLKGCREGTWTSWPLEPQRPRLVLLPPAWAGGLGSGLPAPAPWRGSVCPRGSRQAGTWCLRALALTQPRQPHLQKGSKARRTLGTGGPPLRPCAAHTWQVPSVEAGCPSNPRRLHCGAHGHVPPCLEKRLGLRRKAGRLGRATSPRVARRSLPPSPAPGAVPARPLCSHHTGKQSLEAPGNKGVSSSPHPPIP